MSPQSCRCYDIRRIAAEPIKALIVDGQNNHAVWPTTTKMMKRYLEETKLFTVDVATAAPEGTDPDFKPDFSKYAVVISNFGHGAAAWPKETQKAFEAFVSGGGGFVVVHAADNAFPEWPAYNEMIGLGGWGGRTEKDGPYVYVNDKGEVVRDETPGSGGNHGAQWEFPVIVRDAEHPITKGMPTEWLHAKDELYDKLRGPAKNMQILATAESTVTGRNEPMIFTIGYGKGRVFHTPMGHAEYSDGVRGIHHDTAARHRMGGHGQGHDPDPCRLPDRRKNQQPGICEIVLASWTHQRCELLLHLARKPCPQALPAAGLPFVH